MAHSRLGIVLSTATDAPPRELMDIGKLAEDQGYEAVLVNEGRGDALACAEAIALATSTIKVGTNIANIYYRHAFLTAMTAQTIAELSEGRLILGLGMSHRPLLEAMGIEMNNPRQYLGEYTQTIKGILCGESGSGFFEARACAYEVPILLAALTTASAEVGGREADGIMPFLAGRDYLEQLVSATKSAAKDVGKDPQSMDCIMSIPTFVSEDNDAAMSAARHNLAFFAGLPNYRLQWRRCGFEDEMTGAEAAWENSDRRAAASAISDKMVEQVCIYGPPGQCREQIEAFRQAGAAMPVLAVSPVNEQRLDATRKAIKLLAP
ncbi:MAG: LLM class flavin-dependent oxidoreductase [Gammaproteobacteria bacterium]|nr:LLM class flavin-dependent oxidoreductase [Gammaproteobacteria bacterium]MBQ0838374.1 LLM class flavin-dependent oxidoreductase [Gammaproteobacteria bacterium]